MHTQKGISALAVIIVIVVVGLGGYFFISQDGAENGAEDLEVVGDVPTEQQFEQTIGSELSLTSLPLGDSKYTTTGPKKGYIYLCNARSGGGGAQVEGSWISGDTWDSTKKISVEGSVEWPNATFSITTQGDERVITGNNLPDHPTGIFPVQRTDPAYQYDRNPNTISAQNISLRLPARPEVADSPSCIGGEVGIMLSGIPIFNGFDALLRDAVAREVQDICQGHPQAQGQYHYHGPSTCADGQGASAVLGFALDGFPITGSELENGTRLTTDDLDECHGTTSEIVLDGERVNTYHYVLTQDFPYSVSCFRGEPASMQVIERAGGPTGSLR